MGQCCQPSRNRVKSSADSANKNNSPDGDDFGNTKSGTQGDLTLNKKQFVFDHTSDNIREDYLIGKVLGTGAFGEVRLCTHRKTGAKRAVKIIKKSFLKGKEETRFLSEIEILKTMDHPNILRLFEVYQDPKRYFIVTENCSGGELFDQIIKRPYYSERDAAIIMKQVFSAVSYCHSQNIVHRDLKPENLLLESDSSSAIIKVIDFGTSQVFDPSSKMHQTYGTPYYIAPEILAGEYNEKCDIWSCGVILYILLCGRPPFDGENDDEILENVSKGLYKISGPIWSRVSSEGIDLVRKMLTFDPEKRIQANVAMTHQWIIKNTESIMLDEAIHSEALKNLKEFNASTKLQSAALTFLTTHLINKDEMNELQKAFSALDKNGDGKLSKEELLSGFAETMGNTAAEIEVERIMKTVDMDKNGCIDYSEFISATIDKRKLLSKERLRAAFSLFDKDDNGFISAAELKLVLDQGKKFDEKVWKDMVKEVDFNGDGEISYQEFERMMDLLLK